MSTNLFQMNHSTLLVMNTRQDLRSIFARTRQKYLLARRIRQIHLIGSFCFFFLSFFGFSPASSFASEIEKTFIVTAYYSPVPGQSYYLRGSYEAELRLNGNGTHGASGKAVYPGMIAAPKTYAFGTKIYFPGLGVGTVDDRWGAIVPAGERWQSYDRIDIWMGTGEIGLKRALLWGRRQVTARIITDTSGYQVIDFSQIDTGKISFPSATLQANSVSQEVLLGQLLDLGYDQYGPNLADMVYAFQRDYGIVSSRSEQGAGNYGPKTQAKMKEIYEKYLLVRAAEEASIKASQDELLSARDEWSSRQQFISTYVRQTPRKGQTGSDIRNLQIALRDLGYFSGKDTGIVGTKTIVALRKYANDQKKYHLSPL